MAYKKLINDLGPTRDMDDTVYGKQLRAGTHLVHLTALDDEGDYMTAKFTNSFGESHSERIWKRSPDGSDHAFRFKQLVTAVVTSPEMLSSMMEGQTPIKLPVPMRITLESGDGYVILHTLKGYVAMDGTVQAATAPTVGKLRHIMDSYNMQQSYIKLTNIQRAEARREQQQSFFDATPSEQPAPQSTPKPNRLDPIYGGKLPADRKFF